MSVSDIKSLFGLLLLKSSKVIKNKQDKYDLAASFQKTISDIIYQKTKLAINEFKKSFKGNRLIVAGGVAANKEIRKTISRICLQEKFTAIFPELDLCSDNAAMTAIVGLKKFKKKEFNKLDFSVNPRWQLDKNAKFLKGAGVQL